MTDLIIAAHNSGLTTHKCKVKNRCQKRRNPQTCIGADLSPHLCMESDINMMDLVIARHNSSPKAHKCKVKNRCQKRRSPQTCTGADLSPHLCTEIDINMMDLIIATHNSWLTTQSSLLKAHKYGVKNRCQKVRNP